MHKGAIRRYCVNKTLEWKPTNAIEQNKTNQLWKNQISRLHTLSCGRITKKLSNYCTHAIN
jgi:hypothetical protein